MRRLVQRRSTNAFLKVVGLADYTEIFCFQVPKNVSLAYTANDTKLMAASIDDLDGITVYDANTGTIAGTYGYSRQLGDYFFSNTFWGQGWMSGNSFSNKYVQVWKLPFQELEHVDSVVELPKDKYQLGLWMVHCDCSNGLALNIDGTLLATYEEPAVVVRYVSNSTKLASLSAAAQVPYKANDFTFSSDSSRVAAIVYYRAGGSGVCVWDIHSSTVLTNISVQDASLKLSMLCFTWNGDSVITNSTVEASSEMEGAVILSFRQWDIATQVDSTIFTVTVPSSRALNVFKGGFSYPGTVVLM